MTPPATPPRGRNQQVRTYWRLLQFAIKTREVTDLSIARDIYKQLQQVKSSIDRNPRDGLNGIDIADIIRTAHDVLGWSPASLLKPTEVGNDC